MKDKQRILISIVGPTAVGKTSFGIAIANHFNTEILSVDSRQFYREMEIGTAKPTQDERNQAVHHFVDTHSITEDYNVGQFELDALTLLDEKFKTHNIIVAVGGSGLFFKALWEGFDDMPEVGEGIREQLNQEYLENGLDALVAELELGDPVYYGQVDLKNHQRVIRALEVIRSTGKPFSSYRVKNKSQDRNFINIKIGLEMDRAELFNRIDQRMDVMISDGLFAEAKHLEIYKSKNALQTVGYSEIFRFFEGEYDREEAVRLLKRNSRRYAKRQMTWFKKDAEVQWYSPNDLEIVIERIEYLLQQN
jgi:tRNA dimethylallyltransferase